MYFHNAIVIIAGPLCGSSSLVEVTTFRYRGIFCLRGSDSIGWVTVLIVTSVVECIYEAPLLSLSCDTFFDDTWDSLRNTKCHCDCSLQSNIWVSMYTDTKMTILVVQVCMAYRFSVEKPDASRTCLYIRVWYVRRHWGSIYPLLLVLYSSVSSLWIALWTLIIIVSCQIQSTTSSHLPNSRLATSSVSAEHLFFLVL